MFIKSLVAAFAALLATAAFAAVDVNKASQAELESVKGIGPALSTLILDERKKAAFKDWSDLTVRVKGVGEHNAVKFSANGLTVNGAGFSGAAATTMAKDAKAGKASPAKTTMAAAAKP